jgi:hypothetical protein
MAPANRSAPNATPLSAEDVAAWFEAELPFHLPPLDRRELRKGIQSLSGVYLNRGTGIETRAASSRSRQAASALFFGPLHCLSTQIVLQSLPVPAVSDATVLDLGCGSGAVGATVVRGGFGSAVEGFDVAPWALPAARRTYQALGVPGQARRGRLPGALGWPSGPRLLVFGWSANELPDAVRAELRKRIESGLRKGCGLLLLEPLSRRITPWWDGWARALRRLGVTSHEAKASVRLPDCLRDLDRAAGMNHQMLGARALYRPVEAA